MGRHMCGHVCMCICVCTCVCGIVCVCVCLWAAGMNVSVSYGHVYRGIYIWLLLKTHHSIQVNLWSHLLIIFISCFFPTVALERSFSCSEPQAPPLHRLLKD